MLKIGVLGAGHLGKVHIKLLKEIENAKLVGFFDPDYVNAALVEAQYNVKCFGDIASLLAQTDAVVVVTPTKYHYEQAATAMDMGKHVFIEKPMSASISEAARLRSLVQKHKLKLQVGHVERFNPAFLAIKDQKINPMFIEAHRLAMFNPRGTDVSVVMDLMIHDIDLVLCMVKSKVSDVRANGVSVVSSTPDIANARIEFENGCVANLTASRLSIKEMRKIRLFQSDAYLSLDFMERKAERISLTNEPIPNKASFEIRLDPQKEAQYLSIEQFPNTEVNAIKMELQLFIQSIINNTPEAVNVDDGFKAVELAHRIMSQMPKQ